MAQDVGTVYVQVEPSGRGFGKKIEGDIGGSIDSVSAKGSTSLMSKLGTTFGKIGKVGLGTISAITGGIVGLAAKGGFDRALAIEQAQAKLKGLGHDSKSVKGIMSDALAAVKGTAFGLGDAATVAASLTASGVKQGGQLTKVLKTVADTAQISGRSLTDIGAIFGSVAARGKLQGDDMLQLMSSGIPVLQMLGKHLGKTSSEVSEMVSKGKIDFQTFADAMEKGLGGAALAAGDTFQGALENMKAAMSRLGEKFSSPVLNALRDTLNKLNPAIDATAKALTPLADAFEGKVKPAIDVAGKLMDTFTQSLNSGQTTISSLAGQLTSLAGGFAVLYEVGGNVQSLTKAFDSLGKSSDTGISKLVERVSKFPDQLKTAFSSLGDVRNYFNKDLREALSVDGDPFANSLTRISQGIDALTSPFKSFGSKLAQTNIGGKIAGLSSSITTSIGKLTSAADSSIKVFSTKIIGGFSSAFNKLGDSKIGTAVSTLGSGIQSALAPIVSGVSNIFGGLGDIVAGPLQSGLGKIGSIIGGFFAPGNFLTFFGIGAIAAALVAGVGLLNQSLDGQLAGMIDSFAAKAPAMIGQITAKILTALPEIVASGSHVIESLLEGITAAAPSLIAGAVQIISSLVRGLAQNLPQMIPAALDMVMTIITSLVEQLPLIVSAGMQLLSGIVQGLVAALPKLAEQIPDLITTMLNALTTMLPLILTGGMNILLALIDGLVNALPQLVDQIPVIMNALITTLTTALPQIIEVGIQVLLALIDGLVDALPQLVDQIPEIIASIVNTLAQNLPQIIQAGIQILIALAKGLIKAIPKMLEALPQIISGIKNGFTQVNWGEVGINIIKGIAQGLAGAAKQLAQAAADAAGNALNWVKDKLGIHSPSRVFRDQVGMMMGRGMAVGIDRGQKFVHEAVEDIVDSVNLSNYDIGFPNINAPDIDEVKLRSALKGSVLHDFYAGAPAWRGDEASAGKNVNVAVNIDAKNSNPDVLYAMFETRVRAAAERW